MANVIEVQDLTKVYSRGSKAVRALDGVTLSVPEGIIFGLLGPNGAGKTTMIKILLGIAFPTSGNANLLGYPLSKFEIRKKVGYLPENHKFPSFLNGEEVLKFAADLSGYDGNDLAVKIDKYLDLVKMSKWKKTKIKKYSKGMMQRLGLAQAILHDPEVIFLDEPTDGVDPIGRKEIRDILINLKNQGKTIFLNSHLLSEVELVSDRVAILNKGKIIQIGSVDELTTQKEVYEVVIDTPLSESLKSRLTQKYHIVTDNLHCTISVTDTNELNNFMDELRREKIIITSMNQKKNSLEDLFISLVGKEESNE